MRSVPDRVLERLRNGAGVYYEQRGPDECWPWLKSVGSHGYPQIGWSGGEPRTMVTAHSAMYIAIYGVVPPDGVEVDHTCHNVICMNPRHLRELAKPLNAGDNSWAARTHCKNGHPYIKGNFVRVPGKGRQCRVCAREYMRRVHAKKRAAG